MSILDSLKKKKKQESDSSLPLVDVASLLPDSLPQKPPSSPLKEKVVPEAEKDIPVKRKYRIRKFKKVFPGKAAHSPSHSVRQPTISSDPPPTDPHDLVESSHLEQGKRESLYGRLRSIPRSRIISSLTIPEDLEAVEKLSERVVSVHSIHGEGDYDQLTVIQSGINEVSRSSQALTSIASCLHLLKGDEHRNRGDLIAAYSAYDQALRFASAGKPADPDIVSALRLELGNISMWRDDIESALSHYQKAQDLSGHESGTLLNLAVAHAMRNDHTTSRNFIEQSLKNDPEDPDALFIKGVINYYEGDTSGAIDSWQLILDLEPDNDEIRKYIGRFYLDLGDFRKAIDSLELIVRENSDNLEVWNLLGLAYTELGDAEHAVTSYQRGLGISDGLLAQGQMAKTDADEKSPAIEGDLEIDNPDDSPVASEIEIQSDQKEGSGSGGEETSENCWNEALDIDPSLHDGRDMDPDDAYQETSAYSRAVECFEKLVDGDGEDHIAWYNLATALALKGEVETAAESLEKAISLHEPYRERARQDRDFEGISKDPLIRKLFEPPMIDLHR